MWEQRHVLMSLCKASARLLAASGRGPAVHSLGGTWGAVQASVQMCAQGWLADTSLMVTAEQMLAAARQLGLAVSPDDGECDWPLAWLALESLQAPLPAGWVAEAPASSGELPQYRAVSATQQRSALAAMVMGEVTDGEEEAPAEVSTAHPLLPALVEEMDIMRRRLRLRWRTYRPLESVWLFASSAAEWADGKGVSGMYVDLATGQRTAALPSALLTRHAESLAKPKQAPEKVGDIGSGIMAALRAKQEEARKEAQARRREELIALAAVAEARTRGMRRDALRTRPRCGVELMHAARALKVDLIAQPELAFLAELALCLALPAGWVLVPPLAAGSAVRYKNVVSGTTTTTHPLEAFAATFRL